MNNDYLTFREKRIGHYNSAAGNLEKLIPWSRRYYKKRLATIYQFLIPTGKCVLDIGCGDGSLLAAVKPAHGVGVDFSEEIIKIAAADHPQLHFHDQDIYDLDLEKKFDYIILSDLVNDLWDIQTLFKKLKEYSTPRTRIIINFHSQLWELPLSLARKSKMAMSIPPQNWVTPEDVFNMLYLAEFDSFRSWQEIMFPFPIPLVSSVFNRYLVKIWPLSHLALTNFILARPQPNKERRIEETSVSVIVAARNEAGNIPRILENAPKMGKSCELIFVEGNSNDDTYAVIEQEIKNHPEIQTKLYKQPGKGKGDAVRMGFDHATGDVLMILDADLTVAPEDLPKFFEMLVSGKGEFINGVRLVYPMEDRAMRFFNLLGNKFFSLAFSWLLGQSIKDTLCGTKVLWKDDYKAIEANRSYFGDFDPFGDFDLIFGAVKQNLKIVDFPIRYKERTYGDTNISRWSHGWVLLKMVRYAAHRIKFI